ncbi:hypothetical protein K8R30_02210 [archaeon]|nr:hypothetical protein [archaeon]
MVSRNVAIGIGILVVVGLGFLFFSGMTGNAITGAAVGDVENEYFRISDFGNSELNEGAIKDGKDSGESG